MQTKTVDPPTQTADEPTSKCLGCRHLVDDWEYCDSHQQEDIEVGRGGNRRRIVISCTGFQARPAPAPEIVA